MSPTACASGGCIGAGCKAAGCKAAGLQGGPGQFAQRGGPGQFAQTGGPVPLHFEILNSLRLSRASVCNERNLETFAKPTPKSGPCVINSTRIAWGRGGGGGGGGCPPQTPPSLSLKTEGSKTPPHAEGRRISVDRSVFGVVGRCAYV
jgi:hypothetical protein